MERSLIDNGAVLPVTDTPARSGLLSRLLPLWRHAAWLAALFLVCAAAVSVRLDVQQTRKDLDRNMRMEREAQVLNERLRLEMDARRRAVAVEAIAQSLSLDASAKVVRVEEAP